MGIEDLKKRKIELGYSNERIAELSGVPLSTVQKFFGTTTKSPRYRTIRAITDALYPDGVPAESAKPYRYPAREGESCFSSLNEPSAAYSAVKKKNTVIDYYALPDEVRAELIDGVFYDMAAPTFVHQQILLELALQLKTCAAKHQMPCLVCISPQDVQLDCDPYTVVQPDLFVVCDREKIKKRSLYGAPDFVIEILSASTRWRDLTLKLLKYRKAGVREYWIIDPDDEQVVVYYFEEDDLPHIAEHRSLVPVRISEGNCKIDFAEIWDAAALLR